MAASSMKSRAAPLLASAILAYVDRLELRPVLIYGHSTGRLAFCAVLAGSLIWHLAHLAGIIAGESNWAGDWAWYWHYQ